MPAAKKPAAEPRRRVKKPTMDNIVAKHSASARGFPEILDDIVKASLIEREKRMEAMIIKFLEDKDIMRSGMSLEAIRKAGKLVVGPDDHRQFVWEGVPVCELRPLRFG